MHYFFFAHWPLRQTPWKSRPWWLSSIHWCYFARTTQATIRNGFFHMLPYSIDPEQNIISSRRSEEQINNQATCYETPREITWCHQICISMFHCITNKPRCLLLCASAPLLQRWKLQRLRRSGRQVERPPIRLKPDLTLLRTNINVGFSKDWDNLYLLTGLRDFVSE